MTRLAPPKSAPTPQPGPQPVPQEAPVGVAVRFVPSGVVRKGEKWQLQGTMLLSPAAGTIKTACTQSVYLSHWPKQIEALLECKGAIRLVIQPVASVSKDGLRPAPSKEALTIELEAKRAHEADFKAKPQGYRHIDALTKLWQSIMTASLDWNVLAAALQPSLASPGAGASHTDVLTTGHGDISLLLPLERARSLLDRMSQAPAPEHSSTGFIRPAERLLTRQNDYDKKLGKKAWLLQRPELVPGTPKDEVYGRARDRAFAQQQSQAARDSLQQARTAAAKQFEARKSYRDSQTTSDASNHLKAAAGQKSTGVGPIAAATGDGRDQHLDEARTRYFAASQPDIRPNDTFKPEVPSWEPQQRARARFFALQTQPALARVFNLAVDVVADLGEDDQKLLEAAASFQEVVNGGKPVLARFAFVSAVLGDAPPQVIWTTAKLRLNFDKEPLPPGAPLFWACTREELDARAANIGQSELYEFSIAPQIDGMVDLAAAAGSGNARTPRFELATLDVRRAAERDLHADAEASERKGGETAVTTLPSGGLLLIDRWRQFHALAKSAGPTPRQSGDPIVIDAEDLTTGLLLDIGIETGSTIAWRSLVERRITHDPSTMIDQAMTFLVPNSTVRQALDAAPLTFATRRRRDNQDGQTYALYTDEIIAHWSGPPLGVDLHGSAEASHNLGEGNAGEPPVLALAQTYSLPNSDGRPPRQCFGWPVRIGARPQLQGGIARPLAEASLAYNNGFGQRFALPPADAGVRGRRILRHERIEHPVVTTPLEILRRRVPGPQETALELVIRSSRGKKAEITRSLPAATHRVFVPPAVSMVFADHHDVFAMDRLEYHGSPSRLRPRGGLVDVAYDRKGFGTFPVWSTQEHSQGDIYPDDPPQPLDPAKPVLEQQKHPVPTGDAVFMPRDAKQNPAARHDPYYPDPAAELMVFRLRRADGTPLDEPLVVRVRRPGVKYPDVTPIAVELLSAPEPLRPDEPRIGLDIGSSTQPRYAHGAEAWLQPSAKVFLDASTTIHRSGGNGRVEATRVVVRLAPGERLQLDVWCLPRWETLEQLFDIVESAAQVVQCSTPHAGACLTGTAFTDALADMLKRSRSDVQAVMKKLMGDQKLPATSGPCGAGQLPLPGPAELSTLAFLMHEAAQREVTPELAARTTLWLTHAIDKPLAPGFIDRGGPAVSRTPAIVNIAARVALAGDIMINRASTGFLEVRAEAAGLVSGAFDDLSRGRSPDDQARGIWPGTREPDSIEPTAPWHTPKAVFGFEVRPDGTVRLATESATLMRIDAISEAGPDTIDLGARERDKKGAVAHPHTIDDTKARILSFTIVAGSRTAPFIRRPDGTALLADEQTAQTPEPRRVLLPASKAPSRVVPLTILPAFSAERSTMAVTRNVRLRIRVRRPWFSSGEGERLGIVLWPPDILSRSASIGSDLVDLDFDPGDDERTTLDVEGFSDLDLGPGGEFVSRWGADPTKAGPAPKSWLIPPSAFTQIDPACSASATCMSARTGTRLWSPLDTDDAELVYVPYAVMPLPSNSSPEQGAAPLTMAVALMTFLPRFDVDGEHWYFDVGLDPSAAVEPFVRLGLVRYQANAPESLRVSEPVAEWAQLLPQRMVKVEVRRSVDGGFVVSAVASGTAAPGATALDPDPELGPKMLFELFRTAADGTQERVSFCEAHLIPQGPAGSMWKAELQVPEDPAKPGDGARYAVLVTERNVMRPATYVNEPYDPARAETDEKSEVSGPRFAALVEIPLAGGAADPNEGRATKTMPLRIHDTRLQ